jgi:tetratricopeptide (TPR) repeat protein
MFHIVPKSYSNFKDVTLKKLGSYMKHFKYIFLFMMAISLNLVACGECDGKSKEANQISIDEDSWIALWQNGVELIRKDKKPAASIQLAKALELMSDDEISKYPYVLLDKIELDGELKRFDRVLEKIDIVLASPNITELERMRCEFLKSHYYHHLGETDKVIEITNNYLDSSPLQMKVDIFDDYVIIRIILDSPCARHMIKHYYLNYGGCKSEDDIHFYQNLYIIKVKSCAVQRREREEKENEQKIKFPNLQAYVPAGVSSQRQDISDCKYWCSRVAETAELAAEFIPVVPCKLAAKYFIKGCKQTCDNCCANGEFYRDCVKPFETWIVDYAALTGCPMDWQR